MVRYELAGDWTRLRKSDSSIQLSTYLSSINRRMRQHGSAAFDNGQWQLRCKPGALPRWAYSILGETAKFCDVFFTFFLVHSFIRSFVSCPVCC